MKKNKTIITLIMIVLIAFTFCKKPQEPVPTPTGVISFHLHTNIGNNEDSIMPNGYGFPIRDSVFMNVPSSVGYVNIKLDTAQFYITNIVLHNANGTNVNINRRYLLKYIGAEGPYIIDQVPAGNYNSVSFDVGLDESANTSSPGTITNFQLFPGSGAGTTFNVFNPPATFTNSVGDAGAIAPMWSGTWAAHTGYYFMNVQGYADTSANQTGAYKHFSFQLDTIAVAINLPAQTIVNAGQTAVTVTTNNTMNNPAEIHIICDYGLMMKYLPSFCAPYNTMHNPTTTTAILNGIANMFYYEKQ